ncbi:CAZyme family GH47 [Paecilomyces variotii]|nr:CAZyme family GH47 [Paecilomyces variotii]
MLRIRRYRVFVAFTIIFVLTVFHFARSRDWSPAAESAPLVDLAESNGPPANAPEHDSTSSQHGFVPESPPQIVKPEAKKPEPEAVGGAGAAGATDPKLDTPPKAPPKDTSHISKPDKIDSTVQYGNSIPGILGPDFGPQGQGRLEVTLPDAPGRPEPHWRKFPEHFPVPSEKLIKLPTGQPKKIPKLQAQFAEESAVEQVARNQKLATIKEAFEHAWKGYKSNAMGHDELRPVEGGYRDPFLGWGATLVDSLDSLWIMGMEDEFVAAMEEIKKIDFTTSSRKDIPVFETVIRYLGGLLGAYDISGQKYRVLLDKAIELAEILIGAFDTPNRMPVMYYNWAPDYVSQPHRANTRVVLAEIGSLSMEFTRLAQLTKEDRYYDAIARITNELEKMQDNTRLPGMWPIQVDASGCKKAHRKSAQLPPLGKPEEAQGANVPSPPIPMRAPTDVESYMNYISPSHQKRDAESFVHEDTEPAVYDAVPTQTPVARAPVINEAGKSYCEEQGLASPPYSSSDRFGLGGQSDSTYEYLPKEYMLLGGLVDQYRKMYQRSMEVVRDYILFRPMIKDDRDLRFAATVTSTRPPAGKDDFDSLSYQYEGTHLTCFAGGMFAVGAKIFDIPSDMSLAAKFTDGCVWSYEATATGIMPEGFEVLSCENAASCPWNETRYNEVLDPHPEYRVKQAELVYEKKVKSAKQAQKDLEKPAKAPSHDQENQVAKRGVKFHGSEETTTPSKTVEDSAEPHASGVAMPDKPSVLSHEDFVKARIQDERLPAGFTKISSRKYILRPEAIESVFIMYRLTGDNYWREKGWKMYEAVSAYTRTELAHSAIHDVTSGAPLFLDSMESFWLAETLKYFYLLFSDPSVVSLDEYVLNTEAHPFKRPT